MILSVRKIVMAALIMLALCNNSGCREKFPYDASGFTYRGKFVYNNQFRIDDAYYDVRKDGGGGVMYFYKDGTCYIGGRSNLNNENIQCVQIKSESRDIPYFWGFFIVDSNILKIQTLDPSSREKYWKFKVEELWAKIENDTTIRFYKRIRPNEKSEVYDFVYHFKQCENKPDSMNILLKK